MANLNGRLKVAALRSDKIGDAILTEPAIRALNKYRGDVTLIISEYAAPLFEGYQYVEKIVTFYPSRDGIKELERKLAYESFDELFVFTPKSLAYKAGLSLRAKKRYSYVYKTRVLAKTYWSFFYKMWVDPVDMAFPATYKHGINHEILQNFKVLELVGIKPSEEDLEIKLPLSEDEVKEALRHWFAKPKVLLASDKRILRDKLLLKTYKRLKLEGINSLVTTAPAELDNIPDELKSLALKNLDLREFMALVASADLVITSSSAPLHLSSAFKKPVVAVFPSRYFQFEVKRWGPWRTYNRVLKLEDNLDTTAKMITDNTIAALKELKIS